MNKEDILQKTREFVKEKSVEDDGAHDWWHIVRVVNIAKTMAEKEKGDLFIVELGALLHDIADWKFTGGDLTVAPRITREWLESLKVDEVAIKDVVEIVEHISYRGGTNKHVMQTIEGKIVQDADRLDALGAIGIGRVFAYGGHKGRAMYNPDIAPKDLREFKRFEEYQAFQAQVKDNTSVNHFYQKLLHLKDKIRFVLINSYRQVCQP